MTTPASLFKALADDTRLRTLLLILQQGELCVCEIGCALDLSQPKTSRHLAQLRQAGLLQDRRQGQWIYYQLSPELEPWIREILKTAARAQQQIIDQDQQRLQAMGERPERQAVCC
ncbi:MAG: metalloregulator ArsR/SmtB family transcription factor [Motiliproteus sp.]